MISAVRRHTLFWRAIADNVEGSRQARSAPKQRQTRRCLTDVLPSSNLPRFVERTLRAPPVGTFAISAVIYGYATQPLPMVAVALGVAFSIWIGWHAVTTVPIALSLFRRAARDRQRRRQAAMASDPRGVALRTGLLRLWLVGTVTWLPIGFFLWREGRSSSLPELIAWIVVPPIAAFALSLGIRWAIAGFRPQGGS
jgi:hypothetical protein